MKFGSLFSGIGGFDHGFEQAGLSCRWQVEIDGDCNRVLEKHWSGVAKHKDVRDVGQLEPVDVICGGFPCQDLSVAGQRKGLAGERSGLWFEFLRIVGLNRPRWIVVENVPGLLSSDESRDFAAILRGLVECGYCLAWRVLDAQFYGVAQRRRRVFIVGSLGNGSCAQILFESESVSWNPPTRREAGTGVARTISGGANRTGGTRPPGSTVDTAGTLQVIPIQEVGARESKNQNGVGIGIGKDQDVMYTLQSGQVHGVAMNAQCVGTLDSGASSGGAGRPGMTVQSAMQGHAIVTHALRAEGADASEDGTGRGTPIVIANCFNGYTGGPDDNDAQANHIVSVDLQNARLGGDIAGTLDTTRPSRGGGQAVALTENMRHELRLTEYANSLGQGGGKPGQGYQAALTQFGVRRLTPLECERLQGFPDDFTRYDASGKGISDSARYRMLGNAVAVPVSRWIGKRIMSMS